MQPSERLKTTNASPKLIMEIAQLEVELEDERNLRYKTQNETSKRIYELEALNAELVEALEKIEKEFHNLFSTPQASMMTMKIYAEQALSKATATADEPQDERS